MMGGNEMDEVSLDPYLHVRTVKNIEFEPNGKKISFISDYTGLPQVWEYNREERRLAQSSFTKEGITFLKYVAGTSDLIIGMDVSGNEREQLLFIKGRWRANRPYKLARTCTFVWWKLSRWKMDCLV